MKRTLLAFICLAALMSCKDKNSEDVAQDAPDTVSDIKEMAVESRSIPMYSFEELNPLLHIDNDTTYVVNFWATWCKPCVKELPAFEQLGSNYGDQKVKVVLVSLDFPDVLESRVIPFVESKDLQSEVVLLDDPDANSWIPKIAEEWTGAIPATLIYQGEKRKFYERTFTYDELETELKTIL